MSNISGILFYDNGNGAKWRQQVFENYKLEILDQLSDVTDDYGYWLNDMQSRHAELYNLANRSGDWKKKAYVDRLVGKYQLDYRGGIGNNGAYKRFGNYNPDNYYTYDFNKTGILPNQNTRYIINQPPRRTSGDFNRPGHNFDIDNYYSAITDDRRILGRKGDWDEQSLNEFNELLKKRRWEMYLDDKDNYYKLRRLPYNDELSDTPKNLAKVSGVPISVKLEKFSGPAINGNIINGKKTRIPVDRSGKTKFDFSKFGLTISNLLGNPDLWAIGRLATNLGYNEKIYDEYLKGIKPVLKQSYNTYRQVVGDEASKQAYYRRANQLMNKFSVPFTSDNSIQLAAMFDALNKGNDLKAQGDLLDNLRIRETSAESSAHADANRQRATEVANANIASLVQAESQKHGVLAQKLSAEGSSIDNFLLGLLYRRELNIAQNKALYDEIWLLNWLDRILNDKLLLALLKAYEEASKKPENLIELYGLLVVNPNSEEIKELSNLIKAKRRQLLIEMARDRIDINNSRYYAKYGMKITHKRKDDLLYKSAKDVVEHFRKMIALDKKSSKSNNKIEKLTPHPKGSTKKYLLGGVAPFLIYKPIALGGETTTTSGGTTSSTRSSKSSSSDDSVDLIKELFKLLLVEGLPSDTNIIYSAMSQIMRSRDLFGDTLSTDDLSTMYILQMLRINLIKYNKTQYDNAEKIVNEKDAMSECAIDLYGRIAVLDSETGKVSYQKLNDINPEKHIILTNRHLLNLRAMSPSLALDDYSLRVASNATSMLEIAKFLKSQLSKIESEQTIDGHTRLDSNDIKSGISDLISGDIEMNESLAEKALDYLYNILPSNMKSLLEVNSGGRAKELIADLISTRVSSSKKSSGEGSNPENSAGLSFVLGLGPRELIDFNVGTSNSIRVLGIKGVLQTRSKENLGLGATLLDATKSLQGGYLKWSQATFGGSRLNPLAYSHIILNDSTIVGVDLPFTLDINKNEVPDFLATRRMEEADLFIQLNKITDINEINRIYLESYLLPPKYNLDGSINSLSYKRYAAINVILDEKSLQNKNAILSDEVALAEGIERDLYIEAMKSSNKDYDLSGGLFKRQQDVYKGTVFIPYDEDINFAAISSGEPFKQNLPDNAAAILQRQYAPKASLYKAPSVTLSQIKNN